MSQRIVDNIKNNRLSIYDDITENDPDFWFTDDELRVTLEKHLHGIDADYPARTRSKIIKEHCCDALGYSRPSSFIKTQPRFPGQNFDTYIQQAKNLQIWNEGVAANRRYVIVEVTDQSVVNRIRVIRGYDLALFDRTGKLTSKYQASFDRQGRTTELVSAHDTPNFLIQMKPTTQPLIGRSRPNDFPNTSSIFDIKDLFDKLKPIVGMTFSEPGNNQERARGAELHKLVCAALGYNSYHDDGGFPDVRHQLLEVKLQTSQTIDIGLELPNSTATSVGLAQNQDIRYAVFSGDSNVIDVRITSLHLVTGHDFFNRFPQMLGKGVNTKLQLPLGADFFD